MTLLRRMGPALLLIVAACGTGGPPPTSINPPKILEVRRGQAVVPPNAAGEYLALPAQGVRIKLQAEWPGDLDVTFEKIPLVKRAKHVPTAITGGAGYFLVEGIDPNPHPQVWQIAVVAPVASRNAPNWVIGINSRSAAAGGPVSVTTNVKLSKPPVIPVEPTSGTVSLTIWERGTGGSCAGFHSYEETTSALFEGVPEGALVAGVRNETIRDLVVSHVDDTGRDVSCVSLLSNASNTASYTTNSGFADMRMAGDWNVRLANNPPGNRPLTLEIKIDWKK